MQVPGNALLEDVRLIFRNFSGEKGRYNAEGKREFAVAIDDVELAATLAEDGWVVKKRNGNLEIEGSEDSYYLPVSIVFGKYPPRIVLVTSQRKTALDEDTIPILDRAVIKSADVVIRPYHWEVNGEEGVKAYLKTLYVTIDEDPLDLKYEFYPE